MWRPPQNAKMYLHFTNTLFRGGFVDLGQKWTGCHPYITQIWKGGERPNGARETDQTVQTSARLGPDSSLVHSESHNDYRLLAALAKAK